MTAQPARQEEVRCSCTALRKATRRVSQIYDADLASVGLKTTQRAILAHIKRAQPLTVGALAEALVMDSGGLAHSLKPLERDGYVETMINPADRRHRLISLTRRGAAKLAESDALWARTQAGFDRALGPERAAALADALRFLVSDDFTTALLPHGGTEVQS